MSRTAAVPVRQRLLMLQAQKKAGIRYVPSSLIEYARETTKHDTKRTWDWNARHLQLLADRCDKMQPGDRHCIEIPIRHGKSELATIRLAAYSIIKNPACRVLIGCNATPLAKKFSKRIRQLVLAAGVALSRETNTATEWQTLEGGGVRAVGMGTATAGEGADLLIIDDPIANREDAESPTIRERVFSALTSDFLSRLSPDGIAIVTMSRWHEEDPIGRLREGQAGDGWKFLRLPGIAEDEGDELKRAPGEALWPWLWPIDKLEAKRLELGEVAFSGLIQQAPQPKGGGMFQYDKWQQLDLPVGTLPALSGPVVRYWDTAGTEPRKGKHDPDWTVGVLMSRLSDGRFIVLDVARVRCGLAQRDAEMRAVMVRDHAMFGYGRVQVIVETPAGQGAWDAKSNMMQALAGSVLSFDPPVGDKVLRAGPLASHVGAGLVCVLVRDWTTEYLREFTQFPRGKHDDQVDATAGAFSHIAFPQGAVRVGTFKMG